MPRSYIWLIGLLVVFMLLGGLASWWARDRVPAHGKPLLEAQPVTVADCNLHAGPCVSTLEAGEVTLSLTPRPIRALERLEIDVWVSGLPAQSVALALNGVDMYMGHNRVRLEAVGADRYVGEGTLPVCVSGRMTWEAVVIVEGHDAVRAVPFHFEVGAK